MRVQDSRCRRQDTEDAEETGFKRDRIQDAGDKIQDARFRRQDTGDRIQDASALRQKLLTPSNSPGAGEERSPLRFGEAGRG
jgi:hypothetical protein